MDTPPPTTHWWPFVGNGGVLVDVPRVDLRLGLGLPGVQLLEGEPQGRRHRLRYGTERQREPRLLLVKAFLLLADTCEKCGQGAESV